MQENNNNSRFKDLQDKLHRVVKLIVKLQRRVAALEAVVMLPSAASSQETKELELVGRIAREMQDLYNIDELTWVMVDNRIDPEAIVSENKDVMILQLVTHAKRHGKLVKLVAYLQRDRPHGNYPTPTEVFEALSDENDLPSAGSASA